MAQKIAELASARAALAAGMEREAELLASPQLLLDHPELQWERAARQEALPRLGVAQSLFVQDRRLTDFRYVVPSWVFIANCSSNTAIIACSGCIQRHRTCMLIDVLHALAVAM